MAKNKTTLEEALKDFVSDLLNAANVLKEDIAKLLDADTEEDDEEVEAPAKGKAAKPAKGKKAVDEDDEEESEDDEEESEDDEDEDAPKGAKSAKGAKGTKSTKDEDDEEEDEDGDEEVEYADVQKAVVKAAKANGRDFVGERLKRFGKKVDHASKLKADQYAEFIEALSEDADEDDED